MGQHCFEPCHYYRCIEQPELWARNPNSTIPTKKTPIQGMLRLVECEFIFDWWFGTFLFDHHIWDNPSHWLIFFKMIKTTNQLWSIAKMVACQDFTQRKSDELRKSWDPLGFPWRFHVARAPASAFFACEKGPGDSWLGAGIPKAN